MKPNIQINKLTLTDTDGFVQKDGIWYTVTATYAVELLTEAAAHAILQLLLDYEGVTHLLMEARHYAARGEATITALSIVSVPNSPVPVTWTAPTGE